MTHHEARWIGGVLVQWGVQSYTALPHSVFTEIHSRWAVPRMPSRGLGGGDWSSQQYAARDKKDAKRNNRIEKALAKAAKGNEALKVWDIGSTYHYDVPVNYSDDESESSYTASRIHVIDADGLLYTAQSKPQKPDEILCVEALPTREAGQDELHGIRESLANIAIGILPLRPR